MTKIEAQKESSMKERPIIFSSPMVRAILDGKKTQTRRVVKPQPYANGMPEHWSISELAQFCPYGQPGDRLWVRETWMPDAPRDGTWPDTVFYGCKCLPLSLIPEAYQKPAHCLFRSTWEGGDLVGWKPSIHMPRWASRITLDVTGVRVERLQDISESDAVAEGVAGGHVAIPGYGYSATPVEHYRWLWEQINGSGSWDANPWVWMIEFRRVAA